jgi:hypothetical protein
MNTDYVITKKQGEGLIFWAGNDSWSNSLTEAVVYEKRSYAVAVITRKGWVQNPRIGYMTTEDVQSYEVQ